MKNKNHHNPFKKPNLIIFHTANLWVSRRGGGGNKAGVQGSYQLPLDFKFR